MMRPPLEKARLTLFLFFLILLVGMLIAPFTLPSGSVLDLSGKVGSIDNIDQIIKMNPFAQVIYYFGDANCHQIADRSYFLNGNQLPICSRDLGIFTGAALGMAFTFFWRRRPSLYLVVIFAIPMAVDGGTQALTDYQSFNALRFVTGTLAGIALALFLVIIAYELLAAPIKKEKRDLSN